MGKAKEQEKEKDGGIDGRLRGGSDGGRSGMPGGPSYPREKGEREGTTAVSASEAGRGGEAGTKEARKEEQAQRNANGRAGLDMQRKKYLCRARTVEYCVKAEAGRTLPSAFRPGKTRYGAGSERGKNKVPFVDRA